MGWFDFAVVATLLVLTLLLIRKKAPAAPKEEVVETNTTSSGSDTFATEPVAPQPEPQRPTVEEVAELVNRVNEILERPVDNAAFENPKESVSVSDSTTRDGIRYAIKAGDTLSAVADEYGLAVETIMSHNEYTWESARELNVGDVIYIPIQRMIFPVDYVGVATPFSKAHPALDLGWASAKKDANGNRIGGGYGESTTPIIAPCDMVITKTGKYTEPGNSIYAKCELNGVKYTLRFIHLKRIDVHNGDMVKQGQQLGIMGTTGTSSNGVHLHVDVWKGWTYATEMPSASKRYSVSVDPLAVFFLGANQIVGATTDKNFTIRRG